MSGATKYVNISLPEDYAELIDKRKPKWMSRAAFTRKAIDHYIDTLPNHTPQMEAVIE